MHCSTFDSVANCVESNVNIEKKGLDEFSDADDNTPHSDFDSERLLQSEHYNELGPHQTRGLSVVTRLIYATGILCSAVTTVILAILVLKHQDASRLEGPKLRTLHCGNNTTDARALGCQFDSLSFSWIPTECIDVKTDADYQQAVLWQGYSDSTATKVLSTEEMSERVWPHTYWSSRREHVVHCAFTWQRQHKGYLEGGLKMDDNVRSYEHTLHCMDILMSYAGMGMEEIETIDVQTSVDFSTCVLPA